MKILDGRELAGFVKERQAHEVRRLKAAGVVPKLVIIRDSENPVITKYVNLKKKYGEDIGVLVDDVLAEGTEGLKAAISRANEDPSVSGIIVQLPILEKARTDEICEMIAPEKDVDGLSGSGRFDSATATAILWLLSGYGIELGGKKIALVGRGKLVGAPLAKICEASSYDFDVFHSGDDLTKLKEYDILITATGQPRLIVDYMVKTGAVVIDAGTASEDGVLVGDVDKSVRERGDLAAITPKIGGVGPLTVGVLFDDVIRAAE